MRVLLVVFLVHSLATERIFPSHRVVAVHARSVEDKAKRLAPIFANQGRNLRFAAAGATGRTNLKNKLKCDVKPGMVKPEGDFGCCPIEGWDGTQHCSGHGSCILGGEAATFLEVSEKKIVPDKKYEYVMDMGEQLESLGEDKIVAYWAEAANLEGRECSLTYAGDQKDCKHAKGKLWGCGCVGANIVENECKEELYYWGTVKCPGPFNKKMGSNTIHLDPCFKEVSDSRLDFIDPASLTEQTTQILSETIKYCDFDMYLGLECHKGKGQYDPCWDYEMGRRKKKTFTQPGPSEGDCENIVLDSKKVKYIYQCEDFCIANQLCVAFDMLVPPKDKGVSRNCNLYTKNIPRTITSPEFDDTDIQWLYCTLNPEHRHSSYRCYNKGNEKSGKPTKDCPAETMVTPTCICDAGFTGHGCEIEIVETPSDMDPSSAKNSIIPPNMLPCFGDRNLFTPEQPCANVERDRVPWPPPGEPPLTGEDGLVDESLTYKARQYPEMWRPVEEKGPEEDDKERR